MLRIGITGVPGAGKSTLARNLSSNCRVIESLKNVELVSEYARRYISKYGNVTNIFEQYRILEKQLDWEDSISNNNLDILITDSPIFLGFIYCIELEKRTEKEAMFFSDIFKKMIKLNYPINRYDIIFHLAPNIQPVNDGIRPTLHFNDTWRKQADISIKYTMNLFKPKNLYILDEIDLTKRTEFCINKIKGII